jgi:hypothetical protein
MLAVDEHSNGHVILMCEVENFRHSPPYFGFFNIEQGGVECIEDNVGKSWFASFTVCSTFLSNQMLQFI